MSEHPSPPPASEDRAEQLARDLRESNFLLNQKIVQLETLYQAGLNLGASLQVEEIIGEFLFLAVAMVDARSGFLFLKGDEGEPFVPVQHAGLEEEQISLLCAPLLYGKLTQVIGGEDPLYFGPEELPPNFEGSFMLVVPVGEEGFVGVIDKETRQGVQAFSDVDGHLLELTCRQAGTALANARLYRSMVEEKNLNQSIVSSIANGVISTNLDGMIVRVNPAVERIFRDEITYIGSSCPDLFELYGCPAIANAIRTSLEDGGDRYVDADDQIEKDDLRLNTRISPLRNEQGEMQGLVIALEDLTEQHRIRSMFRQLASEQVVDLLLEDDSQLALGGDMRVATMLFADLVGSTKLLGQIGPEQMVNLLNDCFTRLVDIIFTFNGTLDKYTGDGFLAVFGVPVSFHDDTLRAAQSALAIREEIECFNRDNQLSLGIKIGISKGEVGAGFIGALRRMEYTVIGDSVNLGARLSDRARGGEILVDSRLHETLESDFDFEYAGRQRFKGIDNPIETYQLIGLPGTRPLPSTEEEVSSMEDRSAKIDLSIPLVPDMELTATQTATAVGSFMRLDENKIEEVKMALIEACINAIEHSQSKDGRLQIDFEVDDSALTIIISDRGQGFNVDSVRDKHQQRHESGQRKRGWGLQLMEELMDKVDLESDQNGTKITLVKYR
jgi:adenylate cyclase